MTNLSLASDVKERLDDRRTLLDSIDDLRRETVNSSVMQSMDKFNREAVSLLTSAKARDAFDLSQESPQLRDKYGGHKWGQRALLARRLVEAGTSFVTMQMQNPNVPGAIGNWDIHAVNGHFFASREITARHGRFAKTSAIMGGRRFRSTQYLEVRHDFSCDVICKTNAPGNQSARLVSSRRSFSTASIGGGFDLLQSVRLRTR